MSHLDCEFLTVVKKGKVVKEEWQHVPTSYCGIQRFSLSTKEKTITQKWNIHSSSAALRYALTVGWVLLSHMLWIASWFLYKCLFIAVIYLRREGLGALWIRLWIRKTPQRSSWQIGDMQKESESRFCPAQEHGIKCGDSCSAPHKVYVIIKINVKPLCSWRPLSS